MMKLRDSEIIPAGNGALALAQPSALAERPHTVEVVTASSEADWRGAKAIIAEHFAWLAANIGVRFTGLQDGAGEELEDPAAVYDVPGARFFVAKIDGRIVGTMGVKTLEPGVAEIRRVYVTPSARGHSLASMLMDWALEAAREFGAKRVILETAPHFMPKAVAMYHSYGFRETAHYSDLSTRVSGLVSMELVLT